MRMFSLIFLTAFCSANLAFAQSPFTNLSAIKSSLNFSSYYSQQPRKTLKVAVLDKGFHGYEAELGKSLPKKTIYHPGPIAAPQDLKVMHGLAMAQILTAFATNDGQAKQFLPELHLYNVFGFTNFKAAIDDVIQNKFDVVLYSEVWELGGNSDGSGFINAQVNRATKAGILWINAAGNFQTRTYRSPVKTGNDDWVQLPDQNNALSFTCRKEASSSSGKCNVRIVLTWNDFTNDSEGGTDKDLDLALTDDMLNIIQVSSLIQSNEKKEERPGYSKYPREAVQAEVKPGTYFIRVKDKSKNFRSRDELRLTLDGDPISSASAKAKDTILNPADNPTVITVGASDSERSSRSERLGKPEILAPSSIVTKNKDEFRGSSNSAAIVAAGVTLYKSMNPHVGRSDILGSLVIEGREESESSRSRLRLADLFFAPFGGKNCFDVRTDTSGLAPHMIKVLQQGGKLVNTTYGYRIMVDFDPITLSSNLRRNLPNDMIIATPQGFLAMNRLERRPFPPNSIEVFQIPADVGPCSNSFDHSSSMGTFKLPRP